jgi:hypothetical protein
MKVDLAAASATATAAALNKFRNDFILDSLQLSNTAGQSPVLTVAVTLHANERFNAHTNPWWQVIAVITPNKQ